MNLILSRQLFSSRILLVLILCQLRLPSQLACTHIYYHQYTRVSYMFLHCFSTPKGRVDRTFTVKCVDFWRFFCSRKDKIQFIVPLSLKTKQLTDTSSSNWNAKMKCYIVPSLLYLDECGVNHQIKLVVLPALCQPGEMTVPPRIRLPHLRASFTSSMSSLIPNGMATASNHDPMSSSMKEPSA